MWVGVAALQGWITPLQGSEMLGAGNDQKGRGEIECAGGRPMGGRLEEETPGNTRRRSAPAPSRTIRRQRLVAAPRTKPRRGRSDTPAGLEPETRMRPVSARQEQKRKLQPSQRLTSQAPSDGRSPRHRPASAVTRYCVSPRTWREPAKLAGIIPASDNYAIVQYRNLICRQG